MTFRDRVKLAARVLINPFTPAPGSEADRILRGVLTPGRGEPPIRNTTQRIQAYNDMPWLRAFGERIASDVAAVEWELFLPRSADGAPKMDTRLQRAGYATRKRQIALRRKDVNSASRQTDLEPIESHPFLDLVMDKGNGIFPGHLVRKLIQLYLDLAGEAFCVKERDALGTVVALWPVPPDWVLGTPSPSNPVYLIVYRSWRQEINATEMLAFKNPNPANPYGRGSGLVGSLGDELDTDEYASKFVKQFFFNDATPPFMIFPKGGDQPQISEAEARRLELTWMNKLQGMFRAHRPIFPTREVGVYEFKTDMRNLQLVELRQAQRDTMMQVFGISPEIMGVLDNSNRATIDAADYVYASHVQVPRLELLRAYFQEGLVADYDPRFIVDYVTPVAADRQYELQVMTVAPWAFKVDEIRKRAGEAALEHDEGQVYAKPISITFTDELLQPKVDPVPHLPPAVIPPAAEPVKPAA